MLQRKIIALEQNCTQKRFRIKIEFIWRPGKGNKTKFIQALDSIYRNDNKVWLRVTNHQEL